MEPGRQNGCIVPDQQVIWTEKSWELREHRVLDLPRGSVDDHQSRLVPTRSRGLRNQMIGQRIIEKIRRKGRHSGK